MRLPTLAAVPKRTRSWGEKTYREEAVSVASSTGMGQHELSDDLKAAASELMRALDEARAEADWHRTALLHAQQYVDILSARLDPVAKSLGMNPAETRQPETRRATPAAQPSAQPTTRPNAKPAQSTETSWRVDHPAVDIKPNTSSEVIHIYCMGPFRLRFGQQWVDEWPSLRAQAILKYLVAHSRVAVSRDALMDTFWPEADGESARRNLHQAIYSLRQTLRSPGDGPQPILFENGNYRLNPAMDIWIDSQDFEERIQTARSLLAEGKEMEAALAFNFAIESYKGDLFADSLSETWAEPYRIRLRNLFCEAADWLGQYFCQHQEWASAIVVCRKVLDYDSCHEGAHLRLMECYAQQGQRPIAIRQYHALRHILREELGISPSAQAQTFFMQLIREESDVPNGSVVQSSPA